MKSSHKAFRVFLFFLFAIITSAGNCEFENKFKPTVDDIKIIAKPISYSKERIRLSIEYMKNHHGIIKETPTIEPKMVVLHYTDGGTVKSIFEYFNKTYIEDERTINKKQSPLNVSSQYVIDRDGSIYRLIPDTLFARHTIGLNYCAIGVENIGSDKNPLTEKQVEANANLVRYMCKKYKINYLIGHAEYGKFRNSALWKESDPKYFNYKKDPGADFMVSVRKKLSDLNLKEKP